MKLKKSDFFMDVGRFQTIVSVVIILLYFIDGLYGLFFKGNLKNLLENKIILVVFVVFFIVSFISSLWYLCKFSNNRNYNSNSKDYIKLVSLIREINYTLSLVIIWIGIEILAKFLIDIPELLTSIIVLLILIRFYISILGILLGLRKLVLLLIIPLMVIVIYIIGLFDISFWALVSSLLVIWNFVNSEEILVLLSKGKEINHIPKSWRYVWKRNKIASYVITTYVYLALIISKYFESEGMSVLDRANIRVNTLSLLMLGLVCICIIYHGLKHLWNNNKKIRDCLSNKLRVSPFIQIVSFFNFFKQYKIFVNYNKKEKK
ncbi:hypothetical protein [Streptococcus equinus]|uniref:hypothetical protein n=1 Tax=Streptococcus equinus TaxID=1335 RepID=UPI001FB221B0|nr:hypothetical protein [Streptococcus equinus]UOC11620.1 hypothetical protein KIP81_02780 [Streptococcus equinus]